MKLRLLRIAVTFVAATALVASCGSQAEDGSSSSGNAISTDGSAPATSTQAPTETSASSAAPSGTTSASDGAKLPEKYKSGGTITAAMTDGMAPWSFLDPDTRKPTGADVDLINAAAENLGLTVNWKEIQFSAAIPGVQSGRYDLYVSAMADRKDREEAVNFIDYSVEGSGVVVPKGNPGKIKKFEDLCGLKAQYTSGSLFPDFIKALNSDICKGDPITGAESPDTKSTYLAVASGQADVTFDTYGTASYNFNVAKVADAIDVELAPVPPFAPARQGIAFSKGNSEFQQAMADSLQQMIEDGRYNTILKKWAVDDLAVDKILINTPLDSKLTDFLDR